MNNRSFFIGCANEGAALIPQHEKNAFVVRISSWSK
jgi:hypothetical protein